MEWECRKADRYWSGYLNKIATKMLNKEKINGMWTLRLHENTQGKKEQRAVFPKYMEEV